MKKYLTPVILSGVVLVAGCTSSGTVEDPVVRRLSWFSFMSGDDLKSQCGDGQTRLRLVYNAIYAEDVRVIETAPIANGELKVSEQIYTGANWSLMTLDWDFTRRPWNPDLYPVEWSAEQLERVVTALQTDGAFEPLASPVTLDADSFFWVGSGCYDGKSWFSAWAYPDQSFQKLRFPAVVKSGLESGVDFPRAYDAKDDYPVDKNYQKRFFVTKAYADGIGGRMNLPAIPFSKIIP